ncbi:DUF1003 domain-containing protein [Xanthobacter albus]|uniref:DUF1003 domain-containing protein n=1 Tax=Xanthobacter albus TaxID=3119929 RepID=UPI00372D0657
MRHLHSAATARRGRSRRLRFRPQSGLLRFFRGEGLAAWIVFSPVLPCLAAVQAPVVMMGRKRMEVRDRMRAENDFKVNLKAGLKAHHLPRDAGPPAGPAAGAPGAGPEKPARSAGGHE